MFFSKVSRKTGIEVLGIDYRGILKSSPSTHTDSFSIRDPCYFFFLFTLNVFRFTFEQKQPDFKLSHGERQYFPSQKHTLRKIKETGEKYNQTRSFHNAHARNKPNREKLMRNHRKLQLNLSSPLIFQERVFTLLPFLTCH